MIDVRDVQEHAALMQIARRGEVPLVGLNWKDELPLAQEWLQKLGNPYVASGFDPAGDVGIDSVDGFINPAPIPAHIAYFGIDGTVGDNGAFRIADERGNYLEARIAAATTARVELRKWEGSEWREQGEGEQGAWSWQ